MDDYFLSWRKRLERLSGLMLGRLRFKGVRITKRNILVFFMLAVIVRLFFYFYFEDNAYAKQVVRLEEDQEISKEIIDPMARIEDKIGEKEQAKTEKICKDQPKEKNEINFPKKKESGQSKKEKEYMEFVEGSPMEKMVPEIAKRDEKVAAFLIGIAKKESDWGKHSPSKRGKDCYNYWGYKGSQDLTASGYSCFSSPEEAVKAVGDRIEELVNKKIDTPQKMLVWKCGSSCAGHDPGGVKKWVSDVSLYFNKIVS